MKPTLSKDARRADTIDKGSRIAALIHDPAVVAWFDSIIQAQTDEVLHACARGCESDVRIAGTKLTALRTLRAHLLSLAADGERALKQLSEI